MPLLYGKQIRAKTATYGPMTATKARLFYVRAIVRLGLQ